MSSLGNVFVNPNNPTVEKQVFTEYPSYVQNQDNYEFTNENVDSHSYTVESTYTEKLANNKWDENTTGQTYLSEPQDNPSITINL